jgi:hypothetical protein
LNNICTYFIINYELLFKEEEIEIKSIQNKRTKTTRNIRNRDYNKNILTKYKSILINEIDFKKYTIPITCIFEVKELEEEFFNFLKKFNKEHFIEFFRDLEILYNLDENDIELKINQIILLYIKGI